MHFAIATVLLAFFLVLSQALSLRPKEAMVKYPLFSLIPANKSQSRLNIGEDHLLVLKTDTVVFPPIEPQKK